MIETDLNLDQFLFLRRMDATTPYCGIINGKEELVAFVHLKEDNKRFVVSKREASDIGPESHDVNLKALLDFKGDDYDGINVNIVHDLVKGQVLIPLTAFTSKHDLILNVDGDDLDQFVDDAIAYLKAN